MQVFETEALGQTIRAEITRLDAGLDVGVYGGQYTHAGAVTLAEAGASEIVLAHLSKENNTPAMARNAVETALCAAGLAPTLTVAPRDCLSEAYPVIRRTICRK